MLSIFFDLYSLGSGTVALALSCRRRPPCHQLDWALEDICSPNPRVGIFVDQALKSCVAIPGCS